MLNLFKRKHKHLFDKPIVSRYVSFNYRDIIYSCSCGERKIIKVHADFDEPFPIQTSDLTREEFEKHLINPLPCQKKSS